MTDSVAGHTDDSAEKECKKTICLQRAAFYRRQADEARRDAMAIWSGEFRDIVLDVARDFDELALAMDQFAVLASARDHKSSPQCD